MTNIGWQEFPSADPVDRELVEAASGIAVSLLSDIMQRTSGAIGVRPWHGGGPMAGTAVTVRTRSGDNLAIYRAFAFCRPGDVLVIDGGGAPDQALMGEIMTTYAESIGLAGVVIDGAIRDVAEIGARTFPVFARSATHRGPYKDGPGEINVPVSIGGMVVLPGDLVVGDPDGVLAITPDAAGEVIDAAKVKFERETRSLAAIADGTYDLSWVDAHVKARLAGG